MRNLELIGEAATHIPDKIRHSNPKIPGGNLIATRNCLIHGYLGIDNDTLWSIIKDDIPALRRELRNLKNQCPISQKNPLELQDLVLSILVLIVRVRILLPQPTTFIPRGLSWGQTQWTLALIS